MGGGGNNTVQKADPWEGQQPYLRDIFAQGQNLFNQGTPEYYPGQTVADFSPQTQLGLDMMTHRALSGTPQQDAWGGHLLNTFGQANLDPSMMAQYGGQAMGGIPYGQNMIMQGGQPLSMGAAQLYSGLGQGLGGFAGSDPYAGTALSGLGEARSFVGDVNQGSLPASNQYVGNQLAGNVNFGDIAGDVNDAFGSLGQYTPQQVGTDYALNAQGLNPDAVNALTNEAQGGMLGSNPFLDQMYQSAADQMTENYTDTVVPTLNATFGDAGRTGSGIHQLLTLKSQGELSDSLGDLGADIYGNAYEADRARQLDAAGQLGTLGLGASGQDLLAQTDSARFGLTGQQSNQQAGLDAARLGLQGGLAGMDTAAQLYGIDANNQLGAAQLGGDLFSAYNAADLGRVGAATDLFGNAMSNQTAQYGLANNLFNQGMNRSITGGTALGDMGMTGLGSMNDLYGNIAKNQYLAGSQIPQFANMSYNDISKVLGVGDVMNAQAQNLIDADKARFDYYQQAPQNLLSNYANIVQGMPGGYGTTTSTGPGTNPMLGALGGGMAGYSLGPMMSASSMAGPYGALIGAGLGYVMS